MLREIRRVERKCVQNGRCIEQSSELGLRAIGRLNGRITLPGVIAACREKPQSLTNATKPETNASRDGDGKRVGWSSTR